MYKLGIASSQYSLFYLEGSGQEPIVGIKGAGTLWGRVRSQTPEMAATRRKYLLGKFCNGMPFFFFFFRPRGGGEILPMKAYHIRRLRQKGVPFSGLRNMKG